MRLPRRTYEGAFHHAMNRGYEGRPIFGTQADKAVFLDLLKKVQGLMKIRVLAYSLMDNHYHMVVQNISGRMSDFFKQLNGQFAIHYRKIHGGRGYVFQDRFKTMLIQDDAYLMIALAYVLNNATKAGLSSKFTNYPWSSGSLYFKESEDSSVDYAYVEELFGSERELIRFVEGVNIDELPTVKSELGLIIGGEAFLPKALELTERRSDRESLERRRCKDMYFDPFEKVLAEFERMKGVRIVDIDVTGYEGKRLRGELLVLLKEKAGMTYRDIARMDLFASLELNSLGRLYQQARCRLAKKN
jgi:REP element-mobilizing transposase RayT